MKPRLRIGDVFVIPLGDGRAGFGQIVGSFEEESAWYFAVFDAVVPIDDVESKAHAAVLGPPLLLALSLDAKLYVGHWTVVGKAPVASDMPLPAYKEAVGSATQFDVVDFSGTRRRPATRIEAEALPNRKIVAPVRLEKALRAAFDLEPWVEAYNDLRPNGRITTADIFG